MRNDFVIFVLFKINKQIHKIKNIDQDEDFGAACEKTTELGANNASGNNIWKETGSTDIFPCLLSGYR